jgi:hypothetical protein
VRLLTAGTAAPVAESNGMITVTVPSVDVHEVVAIEG